MIPIARVIGIVSGKGGVGKTTVAINTAAALEKYLGKQTLVVDCNLSTPHVGLYMGMYSTPVTLNDIIKGKVSAEKSIYVHPSGVACMPASLKLNDLRNLNTKSIKAKIEGIFSNYDYVFIDSAPGFGAEGTIACTLCNETLLVTAPIMQSAADLIKCRQVFDTNGIENKGIVLNMVRKKIWELSPTDVRELVGRDVVASIPFDENVIKAMVMKKPVADYRCRCRAAKAFKGLAYRLEGISKEEGLLEKIFRPFMRKEEAPRHYHEKTERKKEEPVREKEVAAHKRVEKKPKKTPEKTYVTIKHIKEEEDVDFEKILKEKLKKRLEA